VTCWYLKKVQPRQSNPVRQSFQVITNEKADQNLAHLILVESEEHLNNALADGLDYPHDHYKLCTIDKDLMPLLFKLYSYLCPIHGINKRGAQER